MHRKEMARKRATVPSSPPARTYRQAGHANMLKHESHRKSTCITYKIKGKDFDVKHAWKCIQKDSTNLRIIKIKLIIDPTPFWIPSYEDLNSGDK